MLLCLEFIPVDCGEKLESVPPNTRGSGKPAASAATNLAHHAFPRGGEAALPAAAAACAVMPPTSGDPLPPPAALGNTVWAGAAAATGESPACPITGESPVCLITGYEWRSRTASPGAAADEAAPTQAPPPPAEPCTSIQSAECMVGFSAHRQQPFLSFGCGGVHGWVMCSSQAHQLNELLGVHS